MSSGDFSGLLMPRLVGARRAYREWRVTDVSCGLTSLWNPTYWPTAVHHAVCRVPTGLFTDVKSPPHPVSEAPVYHCTCGVYAYWEPDADLAHALATRYPTVRLYESAEQMWAEWPPQPVRLPTEEADDVVA